MQRNAHTQSAQLVLPRRSRHAKSQQPLRGVGQDNPTPNPARTASPQPASARKDMRSRLLHTPFPRLQKRTSPKRKTVQLALWVRPVVKAELQRIAEQENLSVSSAGAAFLENALQQNLHSQHTALLDPIIEKAISKHMRSYSTRIAMLLVRNAYASEQTRSLVTNILSRQPGVDARMLETILDGSSKAAKRNITHKTPQLREIIEELEKAFLEAGVGESDGT